MSAGLLSVDPEPPLALIENADGPGSPDASYPESAHFQQRVHIPDTAGRFYLYIRRRVFAHEFQVRDRGAATPVPGGGLHPVRAHLATDFAETDLVFVSKITVLENDFDLLAGLVRGGGTVTIIHQPAALPELLAPMHRQLGGLVVLPIAPRAGMPAKRVLVRATKGSRAPLRLLAPWILHRDNGDYTCQSETVLRDARPVDLQGDGRPGAPDENPKTETST